MKFEYIYIDAKDDISQIVGRVLNPKSSNCVLFIPEDAEAVKSSVNLKLIAREAQSAGKNIFFNFEDEEAKKIAEKIGLTIVEYKGQKKSGRKGPSFILDIAPPTKERKKEVTDISPKKIKDIKTTRIAKEEASIEENEELAEEEKEARKIDIEKNKKKGAGISSNKNKKEVIDFSIKKFNSRFDADLETMIKEDENKDNEEEDDNNKKIKIQFRKFQYRKSIFTIIAILVLIFGSFYFFAKAEVIITSQKYPIKIQEPVLAAKNIVQVDTNFRLPAKYLQFKKEVSKEFSATEKKMIEQKSRGVIKVFNAFSSTPQTLIATTRFLSENGLIFRLTKKIIVPGAKIENGQIIPSFIEAEVEADQAGSDFDLKKPERFSIPGLKGSPKYEKFYGQSEEAIVGGLIGEAIVVSEGDLTQAKENLKELVNISLEEELKVKLPVNFKILSDAKELKIDKLEFSAKANDRVEKFTGHLSATFQIIAFSEQGIEDIFVYQAKAMKPELQDKELAQANFQYGAPRVDFNLGQISFPVEANLIFRQSIATIDMDKKISGLTIDGLKNFLESIKGIEKGDVKVGPGFSPILPWRASNISIIVE